MDRCTRFFLLFTFLIGVPFMSACKDDPPPRPIYTDPQGREIIPCTGGDLCFDPERPDVKAALEEFDEFVRQLEEASGSPFDVSWVEERLDGFRACNIYRGATGVITVDCPDWVEWPPCPPRYLQLMSYVVVSSASKPNRYYCLGEDGVVGSRCEDDLSCENGWVCSGEATVTRWSDLNGGGVVEWVPSCVPPAFCQKVAAAEGVSVGERTCFYSDFTTLKTGGVPEQSCGSVAQGSCAVNCACDPVEHSFLDILIDTCRFVSEVQPVGLCVGDRCEADDDCFVEGSVCAHIRAPEWVNDYAVGAAERARVRKEPNYVVPGTYWTGYCAMKSTCEAWSAANPGVIERCGD